MTKSTPTRGADRIERAAEVLFGSPLPDDPHDEWREMLRRANEASGILDGNEPQLAGDLNSERNPTRGTPDASP